MENDVYNIKKEDISKKKKIEVSYYEARFTQKCGAILLDCVLFVLLALAIFIGAKSIVEITPYFIEINEKFDEARLSSNLFVYNKNVERVEDIVTYLNRDEKMSSSEQEIYLTEHIYAFFDSLPLYKEELTKEYEEYLLSSDLKYEGNPYFIKDESGEIVKNEAINIPISAYVENVYKNYIDTIAQAEFLIKTPNVLSYQRYQSNMLLFVEIPSGVILSSIIIWYIIPICFSRGKKSLGRLAFRIGLVGKDNLSLKAGRFTVRFLIFLFLELILSVFTLCIPILISISMSAFSKKKQNFHDYMLGIREVDTYGTKIYKDYFEIKKELGNDKHTDFKLR